MVSMLSRSGWMAMTAGVALTLTACGPGDEGADASEESPATEDPQTESTEDEDSEGTGSADDSDAGDEAEEPEDEETTTDDSETGDSDDESDDEDEESEDDADESDEEPSPEDEDEDNDGEDEGAVDGDRVDPDRFYVTANPGVDAWGFRTPSGRHGCTFTVTSITGPEQMVVGCHADFDADAEFPISNTPWFMILSAQGAEFYPLSDTSFPPGDAVLEYGEVLEIDGVACTVSEEGVRCESGGEYMSFSGSGYEFSTDNTNWESLENTTL
ncbi:hypothetical protein [Nesterenkonia marinintestina]|uniref:hypothetical protein n=1 Tax=Nesterenkonia marinintestina TaxID=2979865 RepID=UPI0021BFF2BC|nr:hypothetical protein [Nesterenkonia sp. GX14115]